MKRIISSYKVFTPKLYRILGVYLGTLLMVLFSLLFIAMAGRPIALIVTAVITASADILLDLFVFMGVLSRDFDFGLLRNSTEGLKVLKAGVLGDQIRRFLQIAVVMGICGMATYSYSLENGFMTTPFEYGCFIAILVLTIYTCNTLVLNFTRKHLNYAEGLPGQMLMTAIEGVAVAGVLGLFMREGGTDPLPILIAMTVLAVTVTYCMVERIGNRYLLSFGEKKMERFGKDNVKKMVIFLLIAFGVDFLMMPVMYLGFQKDIDLSVFLVAQMMYPACGVVLAKLTSYNEGKLPKFSYITILITGAVTLILAVLNVVTPASIDANGTTMTVPFLIANYVIIVGTILMIIALSVTGKEQRENAGFRFHKPGKSVLFMALFFVLYFARVLIICIIAGITEGDMAGAMSELTQVFTAEGQGFLWLNVVINAPLTFIMFLGEEYGWRYFLQPVMQKKFGVLPGTILLGIAWGFWHVGADFLYYSDGTGIQMLCAQMVTCISLGIFFGYAYMKTNNIWVPVMMHYLNNNLIMVLSGDATTEAMQGSVVSWSDIPVMIAGAAVFWLFALTPTMRGKLSSKKGETENA
ncbi:MAG: CPBP family intramembrane metalloprotease [Lachnospiraceae bacterium]|nr:CPBP family intramembrane metalloprotease [Lachnospiraceae bacterium]